MFQGSIHWQGTQRRACGPGAHWNVQVYRKLSRKPRILTRPSDINMSLRIYMNSENHFHLLINAKFAKCKARSLSTLSTRQFTLPRYELLYFQRSIANR